MALHKLTIIVDDASADEGADPIATAVSNLEYDNFTIVKWDIDFNVPNPNYTEVI